VAGKALRKARADLAFSATKWPSACGVPARGRWRAVAGPGWPPSVRVERGSDKASLAHNRPCFKRL